MKYACYFMTKNVYKYIGPSLKSLLCNSDVDKVYILAESNDIGIKLPDKVEVMDISGQTFFPKDGPNYENMWAWIVLMRVALAKIFPDIDRMLTLDLDTLVVGDISELWNIPMGDNYMAGAIDVPLTTNGRKYINSGVVLWNLKKLRDGTADKLIEAMNTRKYKYPEQDCINHMCGGKIYFLNGTYNAGGHAEIHGSPKILHFAGKGIKTYMADERVKSYDAMDWKDCVYGKKQTQRSTPVQSSGIYNVCGNCKAILLVKGQKYCHECGKAVQW